MMTASKTDGSVKDFDIDEQELEQLNQDMMLADLITPDRIYIDLALAKDFNIGTLLALRDERKTMLSVEAYSRLYQSILDGLPDYRDRKCDDIAHYFPAFGLTNKQIRERMNDPVWSSYILHNSPVTKFIQTMIEHTAINVNHSSVKCKKDDVHLFINTYPLRLNKIDESIVGLFFAELLKMRVTVQYLDVTKLRLQDVVGYDEIYTYYFKQMMDQEDIRNGYSTLKFIRKRLFVPKLFGETISATLIPEQEERIVKSRFDILTIFKFIPTHICSALLPTS